MSNYLCKGKNKLDYFGARYYWSDGALWLSVDPLGDKYPFLSPYVYGACNPVYFYDDDGRKIRGFKIDERGNIKINYLIASRRARQVYEAMRKTEAGLYAFKEMVKMNTRIKFKFTNRMLKDTKGKPMNGQTLPYCLPGYSCRDEQGYYRRVKVIVSFHDLKDRYMGASKEEKIYGVVSHEYVHLIPEQIDRDESITDMQIVERVTVMFELYSQLQYWEKEGINRPDALKRFREFLGEEQFNKVIQWFKEKKIPEIKKEYEK